MQCDQCGCCEQAWSGVLGDLFHACCRACGWEYLITKEDCDGQDDYGAEQEVDAV